MDSGMSSPLAMLLVRTDLLVIAGSCDRRYLGHGAFQELPQVEIAKLHCKFACQVNVLSELHALLQNAYAISKQYSSGACYVDVPADLLTSSLSADQLPGARRLFKIPKSPVVETPAGSVEEVANLVRLASRPLVIIGDAMVYTPEGCHALEILVRSTQLPFITTPMAKYFPDSHHCSVASARSVAMSEADVVLVFGSRLNWILHHGERFAAGAKLVVVDFDAQSSLANRFVQPVLVSTGDLAKFVLDLARTLGKSRFSWSWKADWSRRLEASSIKNETKAHHALEAAKAQKMLTYVTVYDALSKHLPQDIFIINEGANTMDYGRMLLRCTAWKQRLDAGVLGTMGVGVGYAIAAAVVKQQRERRKPDSPYVVCVQGDSAFGFSAMDVETACRYELPILFLVLNNNGIYEGMDAATFQTSRQARMIPPTVLTPNSQYQKIIEAFGGRGVCVDSLVGLEDAIKEGFNSTMPTLINILISPQDHSLLAQVSISTLDQKRKLVLNTGWLRNPRRISQRSCESITLYCKDLILSG